MLQAIKLTQSQIEDMRIASSKMYGAYRRSFQAQMSLKYCDGSARKAERIWGWGRDNVQLGLEEERTGIICLGTQSFSSGVKKWEEKYPEVSTALQEIAEAHCQQEPSFQTSIAYTRLTASEAIAQLKKRGFSQEEIPAPSTMAIILNRMGYRLRKIVKAKPQKKFQKLTLSLKTSKTKISKMS